MSKKSKLEEQFIYLWKLRFSDAGSPTEEFVFHPTRKWRLDFAWPNFKVAVEIEGGTFGGKSRHTTATGHHNDCDKYNQAAIHGWLVLRFTANHLKKEPMQCIDLIVKALKSRKRKTKRQKVK